MNYLYGDLCANVQPIDYTAEETSTAKVAVDNVKRTIKVDVKPLPMDMILPTTPATNGSYLLKAKVVDGKPTFSWVNEDAPKTYVYFGTSTNSNIAELGDIQSLQNQVATDIKSRIIDVDARSGEYIYYCLPIELGTCQFYDSNIAGELGMFGMRPAYIVDKYYVYRSSYPGLGECKIRIV